jgi:hypothetical protein
VRTNSNTRARSSEVIRIGLKKKWHSSYSCYLRWVSFPKMAELILYNKDEGLLQTMKAQGGF